MKEIIRLSDIIIPESFATTTPAKRKMIKCERYWNDTRKQLKDVVVNYNNILIDGFVQYLVLKDNNEEFVKVKRQKCVKQ